MTATGTQGRHAPLVVAARVSDLIGGEGRVMQFRFRKISHAASLRSGFSVCTGVNSWAIASLMKRAVMGVPS